MCRFPFHSLHFLFKFWCQNLRPPCSKQKLFLHCLRNLERKRCNMKQEKVAGSHVTADLSAIPRKGEVLEYSNAIRRSQSLFTQKTLSSIEKHFKLWFFSPLWTISMNFSSCGNTPSLWTSCCQPNARY